jgi:hypothetical protein
MLAPPLEGQGEAVMHQALAVHALGHAGLAHQVDKAVFQHAGADATQHVVGRMALQDHIVDAAAMQQLAQQQPRRAGADDGDLRLDGHGLSSVFDGCAFPVAREGMESARQADSAEARSTGAGREIPGRLRRKFPECCAIPTSF